MEGIMAAPPHLSRDAEFGDRGLGLYEQEVAFLFLEWQASESRLILNVPVPKVAEVRPQTLDAALRLDVADALPRFRTQSAAFEGIPHRQIGPESERADVFRRLGDHFHSFPHASSAARFSSMYEYRL